MNSTRSTKPASHRLFRMAAFGFCLSLVGACAQPPIGLPDESVIGFDGKSAVPPNCDALSRPSTVIDAGFERPSMAWGCATFTNLANQIANPRDLVEPHALAPADAAIAASAVRRYETGNVIPLDKSTTKTAQ